MNVDLTSHIAESIRHFHYTPDDGDSADDLAEHLVVQAGLGKLEESAALKERLAIVAYIRARADRARRDADVPSMGVAFGAMYDGIADAINTFADKG